VRQSLAAVAGGAILLWLLSLQTGAVSRGAVSPLVSLAEGGTRRFMPITARSVPTPTKTPTATPMPPVVDVRVEGEDTCSRFRGGTRQDPNGEYVCFLSHESLPVDMTGWQVEDEGGHIYTFPAFVLAPHNRVRLHSGPGADTSTDLYWGRGLVWNNDHDTVMLYDAWRRLVSRYVY
jgi:hypothetical protein